MRCINTTGMKESAFRKCRAGGRLPNAFVMSIALVALIVLSALVAGCGSSENGGGEKAAGNPIDAGLPKVNLIAPATTGAGEVPTFEWEPVDAAGRYRLVVLDGSGAMLWAWNGPETRVNLGGYPEKRPEDVSGPVITSGSTWSVTAFDQSGKPLAVSDLRPVSP